MANRFCDTEIWNKDWYLELTLKQKLLVKYLFDSCDCAGFFHISWNKLKFFIGEEVTKQDLLAIKQVKFINDNLIFIEDFIFFQYKIKSLNELNPKNNAHKGVIKRLEEFSPSLAPTQPLESPIDGVIGNRIKEEGNNKIINLTNNTTNSIEDKKQKKEKPINEAMRLALLNRLREQEAEKERIKKEYIESG